MFFKGREKEIVRFYVFVKYMCLLYMIFIFIIGEEFYLYSDLRKRINYSYSIIDLKNILNFRFKKLY